MNRSYEGLFYWNAKNLMKRIQEEVNDTEFRQPMDKVATLHVPYKKSLITSALKDPDFKVQTMTNAGQYHYKLD